MVWIDVLNEFSDFTRVSLQATHDGFEVFYFDVARFFFVEKVKNFFQILHLVVSETVKNLRVLLVLIELLLVWILTFLLHLLCISLVRKSWSFLHSVVDLFVLGTIIFLLIKLLLISLLVLVQITV